MGQYCGGDEIGAIVLDVGSYSTKIGYAGDEWPCLDYRSLLTSDGPDSVAKCYSGNNFLTSPVSNREIVHFHNSDGLIENWDLFETFVSHIYSHGLSTEPSEHPAFMSEQPNTCKAQREKLLQIMFETFHVPAYYSRPSSVLTAFANGKSTALVIESGHSYTAVTPVFDGYVLNNAVRRMSFAGRSLLEKSQQLLNSMSIDLNDCYLIQNKTTVPEGKSPCFIKRNVPNLTDSYKEFMSMNVVRDFASSVIRFSEYPVYECNPERLQTVSYEFQNGFIRSFGVERYRLAELLIETGIVGMVMASAGFSDVDIRPALFANTLISGGNCVYPGFGERLFRELTARTSSMTKIKVNTPMNIPEKRFVQCSAWVGGSVLASLGSFHSMWISKQNYEEMGNSVLSKM